MLTARGRIPAAAAMTATIATGAVAVWLSACSAAGAHQGTPPTARPASADATPSRPRVASCRMRRPDFLSPSDLSGFTQFVVFPDEALPVHSEPRHPLPFERDYVCGSFYGFITDIALSGSYRRENNAHARQLGYPIKKFPYVPLTGSIVSQQPHRVLEVYEGIYQFRTVTAASAFFRLGANEYPSGRLHPGGVPRGSVVSRQVLGQNPRADESQFYVQAQISNFVLTASIQGGRSLSWSDAEPYWQAIARRAPHT